MTDNQIIALTLLIFFLALGVLLFLYFQYGYPKDKAEMEMRKKQKEEEYRKAFETEPEYIFKQAKITAMRNYVYYQQTMGFPQLPQKVDEYYVTFLNEDGEEKEYLVSQEFFYNVVKGEEGTLITVNGNFFDFGDGVDVVDDAEEEMQQEMQQENEEYIS